MPGNILIILSSLYNIRLSPTTLKTIACGAINALGLHLNGPWWRHQMETFPRCWPFVRGIHRSPVNSPHKGQWHGALLFSLICAWINGWVNNRKTSDLGHHRTHYDATVKTLTRLSALMSAYNMNTRWHRCSKWDLWSDTCNSFDDYHLFSFF